MDVHVKIDLEPSGPVVVKSASGPAARRLRRERARLARAVHPGVVALARAHDGAGTVAADGDDPVAEAGAAPGLADAGAVAAAGHHPDADGAGNEGGDADG
ncbi:MAG TPA: hypothetical protein VFP06_09745, partial [Acidimicrobiales bacterium]|nr:hypothetical protein [Acidimicrobiales bacterium]